MTFSQSAEVSEAAATRDGEDAFSGAAVVDPESSEASEFAHAAAITKTQQADTAMARRAIGDFIRPRADIFDSP